MALFPESAREELSLGYVQGRVSTGISFYVLDWANIDSLKSLFLCVFKRI